MTGGNPNTTKNALGAQDLLWQTPWTRQQVLAGLLGAWCARGGGAPDWEQQDMAHLNQAGHFSDHGGRGRRRPPALAALGRLAGLRQPGSARE